MAEQDPRTKTSLPDVDHRSPDSESRASKTIHALIAPMVRRKAEQIIAVYEAQEAPLLSEPSAAETLQAPYKPLVPSYEILVQDGVLPSSESTLQAPIKDLIPPDLALDSSTKLYMPVLTAERSEPNLSQAASNTSDVPRVPFSLPAEHTDLRQPGSEQNPPIPTPIPASKKVQLLAPSSVRQGSLDEPVDRSFYTARRSSMVRVLSVRADEAVSSSGSAQNISGELPPENLISGAISPRPMTELAPSTPNFNGAEFIAGSVSVPEAASNPSLASANEPVSEDPDFDVDFDVDVDLDDLDLPDDQGVDVMAKTQKVPDHPSVQNNQDEPDLNSSQTSYMGTPIEEVLATFAREQEQAKIPQPNEPTTLLGRVRKLWPSRKGKV